MQQSLAPLMIQKIYSPVNYPRQTENQDAKMKNKFEKKTISTKVFIGSSQIVLKKNHFQKKNTKKTYEATKKPTQLEHTTVEPKIFFI